MPSSASPPPLRVAIAVIIDGPRTLICRRADDNVLGGYWEFPGGKCEPGETPAQTAVREVVEELGVCIEPLNLLPPLHFLYPHAAVELHPVHCRLVSGVPQPLGCAEWRWADIHTLSHYPFPPANAPLLHALREAFTTSCNPPPAALS